MTNVFIVILNWNRPDDTLECLRSVNKLKVKDYLLKVVVVDNASTDDSISAVKKYIGDNSKFKILINKSNLGFAAGNNVGIKYALNNQADCVLALNNDTLVDKDLIVEFLRVMETNPDAGALSPKIYFAPGFEFHKDRYDKRVLGRVIWSAGGKIDWKNVYGYNRGVDEVDQGKYDKVELVDYSIGTCAFYRSEALKKVGLFNEDYFMYYEDTELSIRLTKGGYKVLYVPNAILWHKVAQSSGIGGGLNDYFTTRNRMLLGMTYASLRTKFALVRESIKLLLTGRQWQRIGIRDYYLGKLGKGSYAG